MGVFRSSGDTTNCGASLGSGYSSEPGVSDDSLTYFLLDNWMVLSKGEQVPLHSDSFFCLSVLSEAVGCTESICR